MHRNIHAGNMIAALTRGIPGSRSFVASSGFDGLDRSNEGRAALGALVACALRDPEKVIAAGMLGFFLNATGDGDGVDAIQEKVLTLMVSPDDWVTEGSGPISRVADLSDEERIMLSNILAEKLMKVEAILELRTQLSEVGDQLLEVASSLVGKYITGGV